MGVWNELVRRGGPWLLLVVALPLAIGVAAGGAAQAAPRAASIVVDYHTGAILQADNADAAVYPASLTKAMTLYMLFEALRDGRLDLESGLKVSRHAAAMPPSRLGLRPGASIEVRDAIMALITKSANDVAVVVAEAIGGSESGFARQMTLRARQLGMSRTSFRNASGLPDTEQRTTARDMARLGVRMIHDFPEYYGWFRTASFRYHGRNLRNHNGLLRRYDGLDGLKTGYIRASGFNLLASAARGERRIVGAIFGGRTARARDDAMAKLLDRGFSDLQYAAKGKGRLGDQPSVPDQGETLVASADDGRAASAAQGDVAAVAKGVTRHSKPRGSVVVDAPAPVAKPLAVAAAPGPAVKPSPHRVYAVQVGAFQTRAQAQRAAAGAVRKAAGLLDGRATELKATRGRGRTLYRAWLIGLTRDQAVAACRKLARARHDCLVVRS
jgi:D-alanyl-D-alanine carboxypeptidase